jgi:hypothetical protein
MIGTSARIFAQRACRPSKHRPFLVRSLTENVQRRRRGSRHLGLRLQILPGSCPMKWCSGPVWWPDRRHRPGSHQLRQHRGSGVLQPRRLPGSRRDGWASHGARREDRRRLLPDIPTGRSGRRTATSARTPEDQRMSLACGSPRRSTSASSAYLRTF